MSELQDWMAFVLGLGLEGKDLTLLNVCARAVVVFCAGIAMLRAAEKRFLSKMTALDAILGFLLASMLARAINGSSAFFPTLAGGFVLVFLHRITSHWARQSHRFGGLVKGDKDLLIDDGHIKEEAMRSNNLSHEDLLEELRQHGSVESPEEVKKAYIERSGKISVIPKNGH